MTNRKAWEATTIDDSRAWYYRPSPACAAALAETVAGVREDEDPTRIAISDELRETLRVDLSSAIASLNGGRGFAVIEGLPNDCSKTQAMSMYWIVGHAIGQPIDQNVEGTRLYHVRNTGAKVEYGARFSVTNAESTFHTDNSFGVLTDYIGLQCLRTARSGGLNQLMSAYAVYDELQVNHPEALDVLRQPFHVDKRGGVLDGEALTVQVPVFEWVNNELVFRYLGFWIHVGHDKVGVPLTDAQLHALKTLDEVLSRRELMVEFGLQAGQILFCNNKWILHNRTAFEDYDEPEQRRHLVRLWLTRRPS